jgi:AhpD family alkylhydroperoxidase
MVLVLVLAIPSVVRAAAAKTGVAAEAQAAREEIKATFGFVPSFMKTIPDQALPGAWEEMKAVWLNPNSALSPKMKELVGLAVSAQIPCKYCVYSHTEFARLAGATDAEIAEAVIIGALTRHWSTFMNGLQLDEGRFRAEVQKVIEHVKRVIAGKAPPPPATQVTDHASAIADIKATFGFVPEFLAKVPAAALPGAWKELKYVELAQDTAIASKDKSLIGLAVAAQVPCRYCIIADTEFARFGGASEAEISEAVMMSAMVRHWSTWMNGMQIDEATYKKEVNTVVKNTRKAQKTAGAR